MTFYNDERPHQSFDYRTPRTVYEGAACEHVDNAPASLRCAPALPTCSQAQQQQKDSKEDLTYVGAHLYSQSDILSDREGHWNTAGLSLKSPRLLSNRWGPPY